MGGGRHSDDIAAWPSAEVSFMSPEFATKIVHGVSPGDPGFDEAFDNIRQGSDVWGLASVYAAQAVIRPDQTRDYLIRMLDVYKLRMTVDFMTKAAYAIDNFLAGAKTTYPKLLAAVSSTANLPPQKSKGARSR